MLPNSAFRVEWHFMLGSIGLLSFYRSHQLWSIEEIDLVLLAGRIYTVF